MTRRRPVINALAVIAIGLLAVGVLLVACTPKGNSSQNASGQIVRVRLLAGVDHCTLTAAETPVATVENGNDSRRINIDAGIPVVVTLAGDGWHLNGAAIGQGAFGIWPASDGSVKVNAAAYRGQYRLLPAGGGKFDVINDVDIESYLQGVLPKELLADWRPEAYAAQAVIARTYALYEVKTNPPGRTWDLNPDERSQVYGGMNCETPKSIAAIAQTRGVVVVAGPAGQERIFKAYFSSCCGGVTSSAADVFNEPAIAPLEPKYNGTTCAISPRYAWGPVTFSKAELTRRIRSWGAKQQLPEANLAGVQSIEIASLNAFGRPRKFLLTDTRGQQYSLTAEQMRWAINSDANGGPTVFSGFFKPVDAGNAITLTDGHGFGHGVGACQWCMQGRALAGQNFEQIVLAAYPQTKLVRAY